MLVPDRDATEFQTDVMELAETLRNWWLIAPLLADARPPADAREGPLAAKVGYP